MLDHTGRTKPILIHSQDSQLVEKLQINEFLFQAQQGKDTIPHIIKKTSQLLELLHTAQVQADQYLKDLARSNSFTGALRKKNMQLHESAGRFEKFKTQSCVKFASNTLKMGKHSLLLDNLHYGNKELEQLLALLESYQSEKSIKVLKFCRNDLTDDCVPYIISLLDTLPYLRRLDISYNYFTKNAIHVIEDKIRSMGGITQVRH